MRDIGWGMNFCRFSPQSALTLSIASIASIALSFLACSPEGDSDPGDGMGGTGDEDGGGSATGGRSNTGSGGKASSGSGGKGSGMGGEDAESGGSDGDGGSNQGDGGSNQGDGGSNQGDGGSGSGGATGKPPQQGDVPMFMAIGFGGRRIISCDLGRTWVANTQESTEDNWHQPYSPQGLVYGNGVFVHATGWGVPGSVHTSRNGVDWTSSEFEPFFGGVGFDGEKFLVLGDRGSLVSDANGENWELHEDIQVPHWRQTGAFPELWVSATDGEVAVKLGDDAWKDVPDCHGEIGNGIGASGGFAVGNDTLLIVGRDGNTCTASTKNGQGLGSGSVGSKISGKPAFFDGKFWLARGGKLWSSTNGLTWDTQTLPSKVSFDLVIKSSLGVYVAVSTNGDSFYYSEDFETWNEADAPDGNDLTDLAFGMAESSEVCPKP